MLLRTLYKYSKWEHELRGPKLALIPRLLKLKLHQNCYKYINLKEKRAMYGHLEIKKIAGKVPWYMQINGIGSFDVVDVTD